MAKIKGKIVLSGNSYCFRIPKALIDTQVLRTDTEYTLEIGNDTLIKDGRMTKTELTLPPLLSRVRVSNFLHSYRESEGTQSLKFRRTGRLPEPIGINLFSTSDPFAPSTSAGCRV